MVFLFHASGMANKQPSLGGRCPAGATCPPPGHGHSLERAWGGSEGLGGLGPPVVCSQQLQFRSPEAEARVSVLARFYSSCFCIYLLTCHFFLWCFQAFTFQLKCKITPTFSLVFSQIPTGCSPFLRTPHTMTPVFPHAIPSPQYFPM